MKQNSNPKKYFEDRKSFFGDIKIKSACIYVISQEIENIDKKVSYKVLKKNDKIALSFTNKKKNNFIITAGNLDMNWSKCDQEQFKKDNIKNQPNNPLAEIAELSDGLTFPGFMMNQLISHRYQHYLMPGDSFQTKYIKFDEDKKFIKDRFKYCEYSTVLTSARILNIE